MTILSIKNKYNYIGTYNKEKYDRITTYLPQGKKTDILDVIKNYGISLNEYVNLLGNLIDFLSH